MKWFSECQSIEDVRDLYRVLARKNHPDLGGDTKVMQEINAEYDSCAKNFVRAKNPAESNEFYSRMDGVNESIRRVIIELLKLDGLVIEICGAWVWVSGETKKNKEALSNLDLKWASKKQMWYYPGIPASNRKPMPMEYIRATYGTTATKTKAEKEKESTRAIPG